MSQPPVSVFTSLVHLAHRGDWVIVADQHLGTP